MARPPRSQLRYIAPEIPLLILAAALLLLLGFQTWRLVAGYRALDAARIAALRQSGPGHTLRAQLEKLAGGTARLAAGGDKNAVAVMQQMQRLGVALHEPKPKP